MGGRSFDHIFSMELLFMLMVLSFFCTELRLVSGDLGTATPYSPPYIPTRCFGTRPDQFPPMYLFLAVSEGLWDGGSACGRIYKIRCLSGPNMPCKGRATVEAKVVDFCRQSPCPSTIAMSTDAFAAISHNSSAPINIEYAQHVLIPGPVVLAYQIELSQQIPKAVLAAKNPDQLQPILSVDKGQHVVFPSSIALVVKVAMVACLPDLPQ
ncbi:hypothetical protein COP2_010167 [Malus domestica]